MPRKAHAFPLPCGCTEIFPSSLLLNLAEKLRTCNKPPKIHILELCGRSEVLREKPSDPPQTLRVFFCLKTKMSDGQDSIEHHRMAWAVLGCELKAYPFPTPCRRLVAPHQLRLHRANLALSTSRYGAPAAHWAACATASLHS